MVPDGGGQPQGAPGSHWLGAMLSEEANHQLPQELQEGVLVACLQLP